MSQYICKYFKLNELAHSQHIKLYGDKCWLFFPERMLKFIDWLREEKGPIVINSTKYGFIESGSRLMDTKTGASMSAHKLFRAFDCHILEIDNKYSILNEKEKKAQEYRKVIDYIVSLPEWNFINFEITSNNQPITWLHCDDYNRNNRLISA